MGRFVSFDIGDVGGEIRKRAEEIAREYVYEQQRLSETLLGAALSRAIPGINRILLQNIETAVGLAPEYKYAPLRQAIEEAVIQDGFVTVWGTHNKWFLEFDTDNFLGTEQDFEDGIRAARALLGVSGKTTPAQKAAFWRNKIYLPFLNAVLAEDTGTEASAEAVKGAKRYTNTIETRLNQWDGLAPYWTLLEYGNQDGEGAFPKNSPTFFLRNSQAKAEIEFENKLEQVSRELADELDLQLVNFLDNPYSVQPSHIFDIFYIEGVKYHIYVTPTRRLGLTRRIRG